MKKLESQEIEYKSSWHDEYLKVLCAFANTAGGTLLLGINDKGKPLGVKDTKRLMEDIPNKVRNILGIIPNVKAAKKGAKDIITVKIDKSSVPISYEGRFYVRSGSTNAELKGKDLSRFLLSDSGKSWDDYVEEKSSLADIDEETIEYFKGLSAKRAPFIGKEKNLKKLLEKLNLIEGNKLKRAAILLFGNNVRKYFISAFMQIGKFLTDSEVVTTDVVEGNLFQQVDKALEIIKTKYLLSKIRFEGLYRKEDLEYPEEALREILTNAVIHKDYMGPHTQLRIYPDKITLWNGGRLPAGIKVEDLKKKHSSHPRNELLAEVFFLAGLIDAWGRGTVDVVDGCAKAGLPEPEFKEEFGGFAAILYKNIYNEGFFDKQGLSERQRKAVIYVKNKGKISNKEYQQLCGLKKRQATEDLKELENKKIFARVGITGKGTYYVLKTERGAKGAKGASKGR